jgi:hypothetical protein
MIAGITAAGMTMTAGITAAGMTMIAGIIIAGQYVSLAVSWLSWIEAS